MEDSQTEVAAAGPAGIHRGFWGRLSHWLQPWRRRGGSELTEQMLRQGDEADQSSGRAGELAWPKRRTSQITRLEEGFDKLVALVDTIDRHIREQSDRSEQVSGHARRITDALAQAHGLGRQQTEAFEEMANQYRSQTRQMQQVAEAVEALPRTIKQQSEQLARIRDQLEAQLEAQLSTAQGVQQLAGAVEAMRGLAENQRRHFQQMEESTLTASRQVVQAVDRQDRRFAWLMAAAVVTAFLAAVVSAAAILVAVFK